MAPAFAERGQLLPHRAAGVGQHFRIDAGNFDKAIDRRIHVNIRQVHVRDRDRLLVEKWGEGFYDGRRVSRIG